MKKQTKKVRRTRHKDLLDIKILRGKNTIITNWFKYM